jgi:hypothetical protein
MFLHLITKMSDCFFEQGINTKFHVTIGKNTNDICAMLYETYRGEAMKKSSVSEWHK